MNPQFLSVLSHKNPQADKMERKKLNIRPCTETQIQIWNRYCVTNTYNWTRYWVTKPKFCSDTESKTPALTLSSTSRNLTLSPQKALNSRLSHGTTTEIYWVTRTENFTEWLGTKCAQSHEPITERNAPSRTNPSLNEIRPVARTHHWTPTGKPSHPL